MKNLKLNKEIEKPTKEEEIKILNFLNSGYFEIIKQGNYYFFGVKKGYLKQLRVYYSLSEIKSLLNRIEQLINIGIMCPNCLDFCDYIQESEINVKGFNCLNCGVLI
jgi:hypothetical protein